MDDSEHLSPIAINVDAGVRTVLSQKPGRHHFCISLESSHAGQDYGFLPNALQKSIQRAKHQCAEMPYVKMER
jgi:hypothetical protein